MRFHILTMVSVALLSACGSYSDKSSNATDGEPQPNGNLPEGILNQKNLLEFSLAYRDYKAKDEFSAQTFDATPLLGRQFVAMLPVVENKEKPWDKPYSYDVNSNTLKISVCPPIKIFERELDLGTERRSNGFGASADVTTTQTNSIVLGRYPRAKFYDDEPDNMGLFKAAKIEGVSEPYYECLQKKLPVPPDQARKITRSLLLKVTGTVVRGRYDNIISCEMNLDEATIENPNESREYICNISVNFTKIDMISSESGSLASWSL